MTSNSTAMMAALFATSHARTSSRTSAARAQLGTADAGAGRHSQQQVLRIDCRQQQRQTQRRTRFHGVDGSHPLGQFCIFAGAGASPPLLHRHQQQKCPHDQLDGAHHRPRIARLGFGQDSAQQGERHHGNADAHHPAAEEAEPEGAGLG